MLFGYQSTFWQLQVSNFSKVNERGVEIEEWETVSDCGLNLLQLLIFGGHGTGGWLTRYDIYHNDSMVLDRGRFALSFHVLCLFDLQNSYTFHWRYKCLLWCPILEVWALCAATVQWKKLPVSNEPPPPRAYHTMTRIGPRFLLIGGYDGKSTFGDMWWLVSEGLFSLALILSFQAFFLFEPIMWTKVHEFRS